MAIRHAVLLIADIGGYTRFMTVHRVNLAHAQDIVAQLLEAMIDAAGKFQLAKLEGDAAFFYAPLPGWPHDVKNLSAQVADIRRAFVNRRAELENDRVCNCDACTQTTQLKLKFVAHVGEVAEQRVKRNRELAGVSVITVHRMLKNSVPVPEYVLLTDPLFQALTPEVRKFGRPQLEQLEGIGDVTLQYMDLDEIAAHHPAELSRRWWRRAWAWSMLTLRSIPYFLGAKRACENFRNMGEVLGAPPVPQALPQPSPPTATHP